MAARMVIGVEEPPQRRVINLTKQGRNARKRPDKTSGRKRPRLNGVDVVAADDGDYITMAAMMKVIRQNDNDDSAIAATCQVCNSVDPPPEKIGKYKKLRWIGCDKCTQWFHNVCAGKPASKHAPHYLCVDCQ